MSTYETVGGSSNTSQKSNDQGLETSAGARAGVPSRENIDGTSSDTEAVIPEVKHQQSRPPSECSTNEADDEELWEDALEGHDLETQRDGPLTIHELKLLLEKAEGQKKAGNTLFTSKPPQVIEAIDLYKLALDDLPPCETNSSSPDPPAQVELGIEEITEDEATLINDQVGSPDVEAEERQRHEVMGEIRECTKACWGNLSACYLALSDYKEAVAACTEALSLDPHYIKALQRRAVANEHIGTWSSLTAAQEGYSVLLDILPRSSPHLPAVRRSNERLAPMIKAQQEKEKEEMFAKLKDLGNGILGKFGLSTDNFKFEPQNGGGYSMRFEQ